MSPEIKIPTGKPALTPKDSDKNTSVGVIVVYLVLLSPQPVKLPATQSVLQLSITVKPFQVFFFAQEKELEFFCWFVFCFCKKMHIDQESLLMCIKKNLLNMPSCMWKRSPNLNKQD